MKKATFICIFIFWFGAILCAEPNCSSKSDKVVMCYYASWSVYRDDLGYFNASYIDTKLCTHVIYTFAGLNLDLRISSIDPENDFNKGSYKALLELKEKNPCLKTLLAIGGWNEGSKKYSVMVYDQKSREAFADSVLKYLVAYEFDGLDIDWEYPTQRGGIYADKDNFVELIKVLKQKLEPWHFLLTMAIPLSKELIQTAYDLQKLAPYVDFIQLMAYDFTAGTSKTTGLSAPLDKIKESVEYVLYSNVPPDKLVLGVATYGRTFTLADPMSHGIGAKTKGPGPPGDYTKEKGFLSYYEIIGKLESGSYNKVYTIYETYYAYYELEWLTFDLEDSYAIKVKYALEKKLRGIMVWTVDTDDFHGVVSKPFPVLTTVNRLLGRI